MVRLCLHFIFEFKYVVAFHKRCHQQRSCANITRLLWYLLCLFARKAPFSFLSLFFLWTNHFYGWNKKWVETQCVPRNERNQVTRQLHTIAEIHSIGIGRFGIVRNGKIACRIFGEKINQLLVFKYLLRVCVKRRGNSWLNDNCWTANHDAGKETADNRFRNEAFELLKRETMQIANVAQTTQATEYE